MHLIQREVVSRLEMEIPDHEGAQCHTAVNGSEAQTRWSSVRRPFPSYNRESPRAIRAWRVTTSEEKKVVPICDYRNRMRRNT